MQIGKSVTRSGDLLAFGNFLKPLATNVLPKSPIFLGNFCKGNKIHHFSSEIIFGQLLQTFGNFFLVTLITTFPTPDHTKRNLWSSIYIPFRSLLILSLTLKFQKGLYILLVDLLSTSQCCILLSKACFQNCSTYLKLFTTTRGSSSSLLNISSRNAVLLI